MKDSHFDSHLTMDTNNNYNSKLKKLVGSGNGNTNMNNSGIANPHENMSTNGFLLNHGGSNSQFNSNNRNTLNPILYQELNYSMNNANGPFENNH